MKEFDLALSEYITQKISELGDGYKYIFYTALYGDVDQLIDPSFNSDKDTLFICFTNRKDIYSDTWNIINVESTENDRISAKYWKFFGYKALEHQSNYSIWVDASILIIKHPLVLIENASKDYPNASIFTFHHPQRNCAYIELLWVFLMGKESLGNLLKTWLFLKKNYYECGNGLIAGTVLVRKNNNEREDRLELLMKEWWNCVNNYSSRDQLTFNFLAENKIFSGVHGYLSLTQNVYNCSYFKGTRVVKFDTKINPSSKINLRHKLFYLILSIRNYIKNK
jgi:hypothetical protein